MPPGTRRFNPRTGRIEVVRGQNVQVPTGLNIGTTRRLGRSGTVQTATQQQVRQFQAQQAEARTTLPTPKPVQEQAARAGKALGDPDLPKRISLQQQAPTVGTGKTGTLQQTQPDPELFVGDAPASAEALKGRPFIPGDEGTRILLSEVTRRGREKGLSDDEILSSTQQLASQAGLKGFTAKRSVVGSFIGGKTLGVPNALLVPIAAAASAGAFSGQTAAAGGPGATPVASAGTGVQVSPAGTSKILQSLQRMGISPGSVTIGGSSGLSTVTRGGIESAKVSGAIGKGGLASTLENIRRGFNAASTVSDLLGGRGGTTGGATAGPQQPQVIVQQQAPQVVQQRQTTTAGALPAFARRNRDRFGGTRTASLFASRGEQFQARRRTALLGGR